MAGAASIRWGRPFAIALAIALIRSAASAQETPPTELPESEPKLEPRPAQDLPPPTNPTPLDLFGMPVHGTFSFRYLARSTSSESDQDVYGFLGVDVGDPDKQAVTAHVLTKAAWDVDGNVHTNGASTFGSLEDSYDRRLTAQLYEAYADYHAGGEVDFVRFGRQLLSETPVETYFDGLRLDTAASGDLHWKFGGYAGVPSHLYESSPQGDVILGAFSEVRPFAPTRARLDWMQVQDNYLSSDRNNALVRFALWQQLAETLSMYGSYSLLDWESRDWELRGTWSPAESDLQVEVSYFELLKTQQAQAIEFDPFFDIAGESNPDREVRATASKGFGEHFNVAGGADVRRLAHDSDQGTFNHDFERWYLSPSLLDWPIQGLTTTLTGDYWDDHDENFSTTELDFTQKFTADTKGHLGTSYSLYKYDFLTASERDHVRSYYVGVETRATKQMRLRLDYAYEVDPFDHYNTLRAAVTWTF
jgi:hypothetical protein